MNYFQDKARPNIDPERYSIDVIVFFSGFVGPTDSNNMDRLTTIFIALACIVVSDCSAKLGDDYLTSDEWNHWFLRLFGDLSDKSNEAGWVLNLMRLHENSLTVDPIRREIVEFWYEAIIDNHEHCTIDYLSKLKEEQKKYLDNGYKADSIYGFVRKKVIFNCMRRFLTGVERIVAIMRNELDVIFELSKYWSKRIEVIGRGKNQLDLAIAEYVGSKVPKATLRNKREFVKAWRAGTCGRFLSELYGPMIGLEQFFSHLCAQHDQGANEAYRWVKGMEACRYLVTDQALDEIWRFVHK